MFSITPENDGRKLVITFSGNFDLAQGEQFLKGIYGIVPKLAKGFSVLTDLSLLEHMDINAGLYIERVMDLLNKGGVTKVVRVIPDQEKDIGFNIMSLFHYSPEVAIITCKSYQESEEYFRE